MNFLELHERLRLETWRRIDQGVLSSSLLARKTGLAQAHISNFLHRRRRLSLPALDRILAAEALSAEDLFLEPFPSVIPARGCTEFADIVPIVAQAAAMTAPFIPPRSVRNFIHLPSGWLASLPPRRSASRRSWQRFVAVRVTEIQALPMHPILHASSIVVLDRHYNSLVPWKPPHLNLYGVRAGAQMIFRYVAFESSRLVLRPCTLDHPVELMELASEESPSDFLVGRVCLCIAEA